MFLHSARSLLQTVRMFFRIFQIVLKVFLFPIWSVLPSFSTSETSVLNLVKFVYEARIDGYVLGGLATPRAPAEIQKGQVVNTEGRNVTKEFEAGALRALEIVEKEKPDLIILQSRSPSCGIKQIYD